MNLTQTQVENAKNLSCEKCSSEVLKQVFVIKVISALLTGSDKDSFVPVPVFACNSCNHVNSVFSNDLKIKENAQERLHVQV